MITYRILAQNKFKINQRLNRDEKVQYTGMHRSIIYVLLFVYLFIRSLFNDAVNIPGFTVLNDCLVGNNALKMM